MEPHDDTAVATLGDLKEAIKSVVESQRASFDPGRYLTFTQAILGIIGTFVVFLGIGFGYVSGTQAQIELIKERVTKTEYQNTISIDDRRDLHGRVDKTDNAVSEIKTTLATISEKLDQIRARQGK